MIKLFFLCFIGEIEGRKKLFGFCFCVLKLYWKVKFGKWKY